MTNYQSPQYGTTPVKLPSADHSGRSSGGTNSPSASSRPPPQAPLLSDAHRDQVAHRASSPRISYISPDLAHSPKRRV